MTVTKWMHPSTYPARLYLKGNRIQTMEDAKAVFCEDQDPELDEEIEMTQEEYDALPEFEG